jgi:hypothetical protein
VPTIDKAIIRKVKRHDVMARWVITLGGSAIIASVIAILLLIVSVVFPLFYRARTEFLAGAVVPELNENKNSSPNSPRPLGEGPGGRALWTLRK